MNPKRTIETIRAEIENLTSKRNHHIASAQRAQTDVVLAAKLKATTAVGKIEREYAIPAREEARKTRDASHTRAKDIRDADIATAHGIFETSKREADKLYEVARDSIDEKVALEKRPHEETYVNTQVDAASAYDAEIALAQKEFEEKTKPLEKEIVAFQAELKPVAQSEIPYPSKSELKKSKKKGVEAGA